MMNYLLKLPSSLRLSIALFVLILFVCSSVRHLLFQSTAFDLGYFDQAIYLISRGLTPVVSFWGYHVLGGHADWILYLLAGLYKIYPSVYWLFGLQAISLSLGALPSFHLAQQAGLKQSQSIAIAIAYLLYPVIFNINLFDFHPEVLAIPAVLGAILAVRSNQLGWFCAAIIWTLGCRDALSLTIAAMGIWLFWFEKKRLYGGIAFTLGIGWFLFATKILIPSFRPGGVESVSRYPELGSSLGEILVNLVIKPQAWFSLAFTTPNLFYLILLFVPVFWGLSWRSLTSLFPIIPTLAMNLLTRFETQKDLIHQYSLPTIPFLILAVIASLQTGHGLIQHRRGIIIWSLVSFLCLAKYGFFGSNYIDELGTWQATQAAISFIRPQDRVLTTAHIAPHLTHRPMLKMALEGTDPTSIKDFDSVLLNLRHPGWGSSRETVQTLLNELEKQPTFQKTYQRDDVYVFQKDFNRNS